MKRPGSDKVLDDIARVAGGAVNILSGLQQQVKGDMRSRMEEMATRLNLVPREDFEQLRAMVVRLSNRVDELEGRKPRAKPAPAKKSGKKKRK
jgi:BMFP domain-containing protein YqiC